MIEINNVTKKYLLGKTTVNALCDINLSIDAGSFLCVKGPSGSGKTTLLNIIGLLDTPTHGCVCLNGVDVSLYKQNELTKLRGSAIGFVFQSYNLVPVLSVYDNINLALSFSSYTGNRSERKERVISIISDVGLVNHINKKTTELSGGQRQRVAIARSLVKYPELILADEPTANLDTKNAIAIVELMLRLNQEKKTTFVFSTHDDRLLSYAKRVVLIEDGSIV